VIQAVDVVRPLLRQQKKTHSLCGSFAFVPLQYLGFNLTHPYLDSFTQEVSDDRSTPILGETGTGCTCPVSEPSGQLGAHSHVINKESRPAIASRDSDSLVAGAGTASRSRC